MAEISVWYTSPDGCLRELEGVQSLKLVRGVDAPCDALSVYYFCDKKPEEAVTLTVMYKKKKLFFGYADTQREEREGDGIKGFIYARSSACLLVDSEAEPSDFFCPSASSLFYVFASAEGFHSSLPALVSEHEYTVTRGTSLYGAVNNYVSGLEGKNIIVTPENELVLNYGEKVRIIERSRVLSEKRLINRGGLISRIDCKDATERRYRRHIKSRFLEERGIRSTRKASLASLPQWQRDSVLKSRITSAASDYMRLVLRLDGLFDAQLYDKAEIEASPFAEGKQLYISGISYFADKSGIVTELALNETIDFKEIIYVD